MHTFVTKLSDGVSKDMIHLMAALKIDEMLGLLLLDLASSKPELLEDKVKKHMFLLILKLAECITRSGKAEGTMADLLTNLSSIVGGDSPRRLAFIIPPHSTLVQCQDLELRQTEISLLSLKPWGIPSDSGTLAWHNEGKSG